MAHLFVVERHLGILTKKFIIRIQSYVFSIVEQDYNIDSEIIESILSSQFCCVEEYSVCKNHKFGTKINVCIIIDLTNQK